MKQILPILLLLSCIFVTSCRFSYYSMTRSSTCTETRSFPTPPPPANEQDLEPRFNAAKAIDGFQKRDEAFSEIAADAAKLGNLQWAKRAVGEIVSYPVRDNAADDACRAFLQRGMRDEALAMANMITSFSRRDEALRKIAE